MLKNLLKIQAQLCLGKSNQITPVRNIFESKLLHQSTPSTPKPTANNSVLYKLRKSTGYGMSKCKEALEKNNNDIEAAAKWLDDQAQKEGWSKAEKVKSRQASQGTLIFYSDKDSKKSILAELNCETDFVAKNEKFLDLSTHLTKSILTSTSTSLNKSFLKKDDIYKLSMGSSTRTIGDEIALSIGSLGENMILRRAVILNMKEKESLSCCSLINKDDLSMNGCHFGKYGSMVVFNLAQRNEKYKPFDIGRQVAQHIVGMKPTSIGDLPSKEETNVNSETPIQFSDNETRLLYQEFLMKPNTRVLDFLAENHATVQDFVRFQCGEVIENDDK